METALAGVYMRLTAADGHEFDAYVAESSTAARGAIVVVQEIFGVNSHIRSVADDYAQQGYWVIAPALFDRAERNVELGYGPDDRKHGMQIAAAVGLESALKDLRAAVKHAAQKFSSNKVGVVGFCWGGSLAWLAATRLDIGAAVGYYGGQIAKHAEKPRCPVLLHFGKLDQNIPTSEIETIRSHHSDLPIFLYDAGHGFNCNQRDSYEPTSAGLARQRTLEFLRQHLLQTLSSACSFRSCQPVSLPQADAGRHLRPTGLYRCAQAGIASKKRMPAFAPWQKRTFLQHPMRLSG